MALNIRILFGTETGNAEDCSHVLADALEDGGYEATVTDMVEYSPTDLAQEALVLIVTSTYGNGDPPYNAEKLMDWLKSSESSVSGVPFAVCGLGDRTYPKFVQAGIDFDRLMEERGGKRVVPRQDCDVEYEAPFEAFQTAVLSWLDTNADNLSAKESQQLSNPQPDATESEKTAELGTRGRPVSATLVSRKRLNQQGSEKETIHYEFSWSGSQVRFHPGDSFAVVPTNNPVEVRKILSCVDADESTLVDVGNESMSLKDALVRTRDLQIITPELQSLFGLPKSVSNDDHVLDALSRQARVQVEAQQFIDALKKLKPRLYSVANSPLVHPDGVHFTVETLRYTCGGREREGVATTWLADRVSDGDVVDMYCVQAPHFRVPDQVEVPVIMIGPGTGIAPFRAFLQHRKAQDDAGENWLFFGHQHQATDFLYEKELRGFIDDGTLNELSLAWSRDQDEKVYVQHLIAEQGADIWAWLQQDAHVYVCGDKINMAPQVRSAFVDVVVKYGGLSESEAEARLQEWELSGRYSVDAY